MFKQEHEWFPREYLVKQFFLVFYTRFNFTVSEISYNSNCGFGYLKEGDGHAVQNNSACPKARYIF